MSTSIVNYLQNGDPDIRALGQKAVQYKSQFEQGKLTREEYDSLCSQLTNSESLMKILLKAHDEQEAKIMAQLLLQFLGAVVSKVV